MNLTGLLLTLFFYSTAADSCGILKESYPSAVQNCGYQDLFLKDGRKISFLSWPLKSSIEERMASPDLYSVFFDGYGPELPRQDGGRVRLYPVLELTYGKTEKEIRSNLVSVKFLDQILPFNQKNGASEALQETGAELEILIKKHPDFKKYLKRPQTFYYRKIAGTSLLSSHSFGIAVDIGVEGSRYWRWDSPGIPDHEALDFPEAVIAVFEKHGFIWGGYWKHYDSMHFEYRPEFLHLKKTKGVSS